MTRLYTEAEVAACLHRDRRWLLGWLLENPTDRWGKPLYAQLGRSKRFTGDDVMKIIDMILTQEEAARPPTAEGVVYFVAVGSRIKIGYSRSLDSRLQKMRTENPDVAVLHTEPGTFKTEKVLHREFAKFRIAGEWFTKDPALLRHIEQRKAICP